MTSNRPWILLSCDCRHKLGLAVAGLSFWRNSQSLRGYDVLPFAMKILGVSLVTMNPRRASSKSCRLAKFKVSCTVWLALAV